MRNCSQQWSAAIGRGPQLNLVLRGVRMLESLYEQLSVSWQPVMDLRLGTPWGYEAVVSGPSDTAYATADSLLELARREGQDRDYEWHLLHASLAAAARELPKETMLLLRADADPLRLEELAPNLPWPPSRTIIEISEGSGIFERPDDLAAAIGRLRQRGFHIAFADFGSGFHGAGALLACRPDIVKIDRLLVHGIDRDPWRQEMVASIVQTATGLGAAVVADGIDDVAELHEIVRQNIALGEGPLLGRPVAASKVAKFTEGWLHSRLDASDQLAAVMPKTGAAYAVDRSRHIVAWNEAAVDVTGYQPGAVVGVTCWLSGLDHKDAAGTRLCFGQCPLVRAMLTGQPQSELVSLRTAGGARKWVRTEVTPVTDENGRVIGAVESFVRAHKPETDQT